MKSDAWLWLIAIILVFIAVFVIVAIATNSHKCRNEERKFRVGLVSFDDGNPIPGISGNDTPILIVDKEGINLHYNLIIKGLKCKEDLRIYLANGDNIIKELSYTVSPRGSVQSQGIWSDKDEENPMSYTHVGALKDQKVFLLIMNKEYPKGYLKGFYMNETK